MFGVGDHRQTCNTASDVLLYHTWNLDVSPEFLVLFQNPPVHSEITGAPKTPLSTQV